MKILVTGAVGFIGGHFLKKMLDETDCDLVGLDNFNDYYDPALKRDTAAAFEGDRRVRIVEGDFCNADTVMALFAEHRFDHVVHLGAYAGVRYSVENPIIYQEANVKGTLMLLEAARRWPVRRFLLISSSTVYGTGASIPFCEDAPLGTPASPYGATKRSAELLGLTYHQLHDVPVVCLRPFSVYGPRLRPDLAMTIFAKAIHDQKRFTLYGDGTIRRDYTHVSDICDGLAQALLRDGVTGETINLGNSEPIEMKGLIDLLADGLGRAPLIEQRPQRPEDLPVTFANLDKANRLLGYAPKVSIEQGVAEYCAWFSHWYEPSHDRSEMAT